MVTDEQLLAAGFAGCGEGRFIKRLKAEDMPYVSEHIVDDVNLSERAEVLVEVSSDRMVKMTIPSFDKASEPPIPMDTVEGRALLRDAGVRF
jgi:hypothetical protein